MASVDSDKSERFGILRLCDNAGLMPTITK